METEIKTENQTVVESAPVRVTIGDKGTVYASFNLMQLNNANDLRMAARTLNHAASLLEPDKDEAEKIKKLMEEIKNDC